MPLQFLAFASPPSVPFSLFFALFLLLSLPFSSNSTNSTTTIRLSLNLPKQTFSAELSLPDSSAFLEASGAVRAALADIWREESAYRGSSVRRFRYQPTLGILANVDAHFANVYSGALLHKFRWELERALRTGQIGWLAVSEDGFEFNAIEGPFAKLTLTCPDGALPSFSLHGSTYCWSHSVCPSGTSCVEGQCCKSARSADQLRRCDPLLHWECADNVCIPSARRCDGIADCKDGATLRDSTDEAYCNSGNEKRSVFGAPEGQCPQGQFRCREDGTCIANEKVCDRKPFDCSDGTDETRCDYYLNNKRAEAEKTAAIAQQQRPRRCAEDEIRCPKVALGRCIHYTKLCDGTDDCGDGSDERNCKSGSERVDADIVVASVSPNELGWGEVSDGPGPTIVTLGGERVIGEIGTEEGSSVGPLIVRPMDPRVIGELRPGENTKGTIGPTPTTSRVIQEIQRSQNTAGTISPLPIGPSSKCGINEFLCKDGKKCIAMTAKCNRKYDCADGSDELDCDYFKEAEERRQQQKQTKTEEKEQLRTPTEQQQCHLRQGHFFCPISRQCIDQRRKCDGRIDCEHGEDEANCVARVKPIDLQINVHPPELSVREGREASFECRARTTDNSFYPEVRWTRVGGRLPDGVREGGGRLTIPQAQLHHAGQYACVAMHNGRTVEAHATLHVQSYGPQELQGDTNAVAAGCMADERACGSNECVKLDYVCDGEPDCRDRSDELNCPAKRLCEPNEFKCKNSRCVQKMWLCDGDDDCGDGSDEKSCGERKHGDLCQATEFSCSSKKQCVPASFQCDGTNDCQDGSDEIGCVQPTVVQPPESNMVVQQGQDFKLTCRAVGVPDPYINWRLNWADVCEPPRCQQVSQGGVGTLSVQNAQPMDQGAYTCEAINVKGRVLATPDCIVRIVSIPAPQAPQPPPPPQPEPQRLACSSQGAYSPYSDARGQCQCKPLTTGPTCAQCVPGAYHLSDRAPQGCLKCFCFGVTDRCHSSGLFRTKQKLFFADDAQGVELSNVQGQTQPGVQFEFEKYGYLTHTEPHFSQTLYWKLPKRFLGNKVTAYGGDFTVQLQYDGQGQIREEPLVVIQGNGVTLVHKPTDQQAQFVPGQPFTISVNTYEQNFEHQNGSPATREDLMMALAGLNLVLIRATHTDDQTSTSLGDTSWEIAVSKDTQDERALEVEQCECPPGYVGTSCEECAEGYERSGQGPYLGHCVPARQPPARPLCDSAGALSAHPQHDGRCDCKPNVVVPLRVEILQPKQLTIQEGSRAKWTCKIVSADKPDLVDIQWSKIGEPELPERAQQFGHQLVIDQVQQQDTGHYRCTGRLKGDISTDDATLTIASPQAAPAFVHYPATLPPALPAAPAQMPKPSVTPPHQLVDEGQQAVFTCLTPGYADCEVQWHFQRLGGPLPHGWQQRGNQIIVQSAQQTHAGDYICSVTHQFGTTASDPGRLEIRKPPSVCPPVCHAPPVPAVPAPLPMRPLVEPPEIETDLGSPARFRCWVPGVPGAVLTWRPSHGGPLPSGADQSGGYLDFPSVSQHHPGQYVCAAYDPSRDPIGSQPVDSDNVRLKLRPKKPFQVLVEPPYQIVDEGQPLPRPYRCWVPGYPQAVLKWRPALDEMLPSGVEEQHNGALLNIPRAELRHAGDYICTAYDPHDDPRGERTVDSTPVRLDVRRPSPPPPARARNPPQVEPPYQRVDLGQPARFRCWVPGEPNAHLSWAPARGGSLPSGAVDRSGHLLFDAVAREHADSYICSSIDPETGQILQSPPVRLDVSEPSKRPLVEPTEQTVQQGHPSRIRCWVPDEPRATLRWTARGGRPLPSGAVDDGRGNLNIAQTLPHHQGDYECIYEPREPSRGPQVSEPARIYVSPPPVGPLERKPGEPPRPVATPPQQTVPRGDPARFHCEPNSKTPAQIHWGFESPNGALPSGVSVDGEDILIAAADEATIGEYHCTATNEFGRGHADPVKLDITDEEEPPTARVEPKVWNGQPGESKQFKCYVTGNPHPSIKWSGPNGDELPEDVVDLGDGVLEIKDAKKELHDGEYTCTATNPLGEASDSGKVEIGPSIGINIIKEEKPAPARLKMIVGEPLEIKCEAEGEPDPDVEWLHDPGPERGDLPDDYVPITISEQFLRHPSIGLGNSGCYTCRASNDFASVTKGICIEVIEPSGMTTVGILGGSHQWFPADQPAELICAASVSSLVERVEWKRAGGDALPSDASDEEHRGVLRFDPFKPADHAGEYECNAYRNEEVIATSKVEVHPEGDTRPDLLHVDISPPQVRVVNAGDSIVLDCVVHGRSADEFTYSWSLARGGALIRELGRQSQLLVKSADPSNDYGIYRCEVESEDGETVGQAQAAVSVGFDSENSAVEAKFDGDSQAVLNCPVFVVPGSTVDWQRENGESLPENSNQSGDKLLIEKFDDSTAGIYRCTVHHGQSSVSGFVNAKIFVPDTIIKVLLNVSSESVQVGDQAWLDCVVIGDPNARVNFSKDGDALPANAQVTANRLLFTSISVEHTGRYRCQAQTKDGVLETSALLNVEGGEETEAEKRRRSFHQQKQQQKTEQEEEGTPAEEEAEEEEKGPQYTLAEGQSAAESDADTVQAVEIGRPEPDHPQRMRRLRRLRQQRRRATSHRKRTQHKEEEEEGKKKQRKRKRTEHAQHKRKKSIAEVRKENLRRRAERYRNGRTQFQKYYHHYEIRNDAPPAALHRARLFGSWF